MPLSSSTHSKVISSPLFRFLVVGGINTMLHTSVAITLLWGLQTSVVTANTTGFLSALIFSFIANTLWSFQQPIKRLYFIKFIIVNVITYSLNFALSTASDFNYLPPILAVLAIALASPLIGYTLHRLWTYNISPPINGGTRNPKNGS